MMIILADPTVNRSRSGATVSMISYITKESEETSKINFSTTYRPLKINCPSKVH